MEFQQDFDAATQEMCDTNTPRFGGAFSAMRFLSGAEVWPRKQTDQSGVPKVCHDQA
ncbi:hypothetical protein [Streptomyces sp. NPDC097610]|uniref:hypothetical protein n=1 Tax=Streptomyces sp. NPDC097610 TaxID=3157227 RepID=UPI0033185B76